MLRHKLIFHFFGATSHEGNRKSVAFGLTKYREVLRTYSVGGCINQVLRYTFCAENRIYMKHLLLCHTHIREYSFYNIKIITLLHKTHITVYTTTVYAITPIFPLNPYNNQPLIIIVKSLSRNSNNINTLSLTFYHDRYVLFDTTLSMRYHKRIILLNA